MQLLIIGNTHTVIFKREKVNLYVKFIVMENTIKATGKDCYDAVKGAFTEMMQLIFTPDGRCRINKAFQ
jgi:hypothetical protein